MTTLRKVSTKSDLKAFIDYPYKKYANDPLWVPPLHLDEWDKFNPKKNPFYEHARMELFLAERDGKVVGRVAAIDNDAHNDVYKGDNLAFFGFFEAQDQAIATALFHAVETYAKSLGRSHVRGPVNPSMDDGAGFQLNAYDTTPYLMMIQNPPEYPGFAEAAGYSKIKDLYAFRLRSDLGISDKIKKLAERVRKRTNFTIRSLNMRDFDNEVDRVLSFYNEEWEANWGHIKYSDKQAKLLAKQLKLIVDPELILFMEIDGEIIGVGMGFPDANQMLHKIKDGRLIPYGILPFLNKRKIMKRTRMTILGVRKPYRGKGLELVMIEEFANRALARGYVECECSWELEDNHAINNGIIAAGGELYKTYRMYQKSL
ncbi:MAG: GNAT family N-acetyltransferase [Trueperaceae bacterium]